MKTNPLLIIGLALVLSITACDSSKRQQAAQAQAQAQKQALLEVRKLAWDLPGKRKAAATGGHADAADYQAYLARMDEARNAAKASGADAAAIAKAEADGFGEEREFSEMQMRGALSQEEIDSKVADLKHRNAMADAQARTEAAKRDLKDAREMNGEK